MSSTDPTFPSFPPPSWPAPDERPAATVTTTQAHRPRSRWAMGLVAGLVAGALSGAGVAALVADDGDSAAVTASGLSTVSSTAPVGQGPVGNPSSDDIDVPGVIAKVQPAVVSIRTKTFGAFGGAQQAAGSGFLVSADGVIYTNAHVVDGAEEVDVTLDDGRTLSGTVLGVDTTNDLAAVKVDATDLPTLPLGDSTKLRMGDPVVAIGNALALEGGPTATSGIVSALDRTIDTNNGEHLTGLLQTDAAINPGNSGGPLVNVAGEVVGINTAAAGNAENVGFAISLTKAQALLEGLRSGQVAARPFLGVQTSPIDAATAQRLQLTVDEGALVVAVVPGSAAEEAGLEQGDVITRIGSTTIASPEDVSDALQAAEPGDQVSLDVVRGSQTLTVQATLGRRA